MTTIKQAKTLFDIIFKNSLKKVKGLGEKKAQKIFSLVAISFSLVMILTVIVIMTTTITRAAIDANVHGKLLYVFVATAQFAVLVLGAFATMSYLYFSKDNCLLAALPISSKAVFLAKFVMAYVTELVFGALVLLPTVTTFGIVCMVYGVPINASFFILEAIGVFIFPIIPLLFISLISLPLMYLMAFLRKRTLSNAIAIAIVIIIVMSLYFSLIGGFTNLNTGAEEGNMALSSQLIMTINNIAKTSIFNKPYIEAMLGKNVIINTFIYIVGILVLLFINITLSSFFYKKGISVIIEGDGTRDNKKSKKELVYTSTGLKYSLFKKEVKTLANTPMMLVNSLIGIILAPIIVVFMTKSGAMTLGSVDPRTELYAIGFISYLVAIMVGATNQVAMVGFSREGKNLFTLKALPLSAEMLVKTKLFVATCINIAAVFIVSVVYFVMTHKIISAIGIAMVTLSCGFGVNCLGLYNDLKKPNLNWTNATELTKNNKNSLKPILTIFGIGFTYMIAGAVLGMQTAIGIVLSYTIFFSVSFIVNAIIIIINYKKLFENPKELLESVEG